MGFTESHFEALVHAAKSLPLDAPMNYIEDFFSFHLEMNEVQISTAMADDSAGVSGGSIAISHLTSTRETILRDECDLPSFVIFEEAGRTIICGLLTYIEDKGLDINTPTDFLSRIKNHSDIRRELIELDSGHRLEALAGAILASACHYGSCTRGSGDQGIDAIGWKELIAIEQAFTSGDMRAQLNAGHRIVFLASSKAALGRTERNKLINPAHIRELVGSWLIQRSTVGKWGSFGIQMLTPLQLILVTTYRLSEESKSECIKLGIQVWSIPELIFLVCRHAPANVFPPSSAEGVQLSHADLIAWAGTAAKVTNTRNPASKLGKHTRASPAAAVALPPTA